MRRLLFALVVLAAVPLPAASSLPPWLPLPHGVSLTGEMTEEAFGEADFAKPDGAANVQRGRHWQTGMAMSGMPDDASHTAIWAKIRPSIVAAGWTIAYESDVNPLIAIAHLTKGHNAWARFEVYGADDIRLDLIDVAAASLTIKLPPPAKTPEVIGNGNIPYLLPPPGSQLTSAGVEPVPLELMLPGSSELQVVGTSTIKRSYSTPQTLSNVEVATAYRNALTAAGWNVLEVSQGIGQTDTVVVAHYARDGRDVWANLHYAPGDLGISVADAGANDLAKTLKAQCHVPLYGVMFDFNKATLRPESEPVLTRAAAALKASPSLAIEVQGHTDNVGTDSYNAQLSDARAKSVMQWLVAHGVPASQLTARGYGKSKPVADNGSDAGRAKNRRVELACRK